MERLHVAWLGFGAYVALTLWLAWVGMKKTRDLSSFAIGNKDMGPVMVGITLATSVASTATFVINPGFVFTHGLSALLHFGVAALSGVVVGIIVLTKGFRAVGERTSALTLPHWIGARYAHGGMRSYFALLNLLLTVSFVVLILKGSGILMQHTLGLPYGWSVLLITAFVFAYIMMGGTYALAYTNVIQGVLMLAIAVVIFFSGIHLFSDGLGAFFAKLAVEDPNLVRALNPASPLYSDVWEVFVSPFIVALGLVCQPHILTKALLLRSDRDVNRYLGVATGIGLIFALVLFGGLYARILHPELTKIPQDAIVATYLSLHFPSVLGVVVSVVLLAASVSTLDGFLLSASTIAGNDLVLGALGQRIAPNRTPEERQRLGLKVSRWILVGMGIVTLMLALNPPALAGIFAQVGVYGLIAASLAPIAMGIFVRDVEARHAFAAAIIGPLAHFAYYFGGMWARSGGIDWTAMNPAVTGTVGILASFATFTALTVARRLTTKRAVPAVLEGPL